MIVIAALGTAIFFYHQRKSKKETQVNEENQFLDIAELPQGRHHEKTELEVKNPGVMGFRAELSGDGILRTVADVKDGSQLNLTREVSHNGSTNKRRNQM